LDEDIHRVLKTIKALGLEKIKKVKVGGVEVSPREVVASCSPDPAKIGHLMKGVAVGIWTWRTF